MTKPRMSQINVRLQSADKLEFDILCKRHGTNVTQALTAYITHCLETGSVLGGPPLIIHQEAKIQELNDRLAEIETAIAWD